MFTRPDGRAADQMRPVKIIRGYTKFAPGSVLVSYGDTQVLVTVMIEERVPRHVIQNHGDNAGWITAEYSLLPGSTQVRTQRERLKLSGRTNEIQRLIGRSIRASFDTTRLGQRTFHIDADVLQADAGTRVAAVTGGFVAMMEALYKLVQAEQLSEIPLISPVAGVSVGIVEGTTLLDLSYEEDSSADVDSNIVLNGRGELIEIQATSEKNPFGRDQLTELLDMAAAGANQVFAAQTEALGEIMDAVKVSV